MSELIARTAKQLHVEEGAKLQLYRDTKGFLTIGVGRNIQTNGIKPDEAELMLANDIKDSIAFLQQFKWYEEASDVRKAALIDMSFMGAEKLLHFVKMIAAMMAHDFEAAANEILNSKWAADVKETRAGRVAAMMKTGAWPLDIPFGGFQ